MYNFRFFSNNKLKVNQHEIQFLNAGTSNIKFNEIERLEVLVEDKSYKAPIFVIIYFKNCREFLVVRFDKFNFKRPKKQFEVFINFLPVNIRNKLIKIEKEYISVVLNKLEKGE